MAGPRKPTGTSKSRSTAAKTTAKTTPRKAPAKPAAAEGGSAPVKLVEPRPKPEITVVGAPEPVVAERMVKKVELIDRVVEATGMKKKDVKPAVEATLAEIDKIIGEGADIQSPELGKLMIHKRKEVPNGEVVMLKLRRKTGQKPLAKDDDNG